MLEITTASDLRRQVAAWRAEGSAIGFVATMGNLHPGHLALVREAQRRCRRVVCSIFVNPLQFGPNEDFSRYPRTIERDRELLAGEGCDLLYVPSAADLYPAGHANTTRVEVAGVTGMLEGEHRPGHFTGVATVVLKLFNLVTPDVSVFGKKDFQQLAVVRRMVADLDADIEIVGHATEREPSGLAISSRNQYLDAAERQQAPLIYKLLKATKRLIEAGSRDYAKIEADAANRLAAAGFAVDYFTIRNPLTLEPATAGDRDLVVLVTARLGSTRLLDNIEISLDRAGSITARPAT